MAPKRRRTKIVATWGPALAKDERLRDAIRGGVDVFRLNFSHASHDEVANVVPRIRRIAEEEQRAIALLQDIQGPRIRTGALLNGLPIELETGSLVTISPENGAADPRHIHVTYPGFAHDVRVGDRILIADGTLVLRAERVSENTVDARIEHGGPLGEHKGVNLPDSQVSVEPLTEKDIVDLRFGAEIDVDYVALSFVRRASDVEACKDHLRGMGRDTPVISKIEHPLAIANLEAILEASDGVMVARGDLGVEVSPERVPLLQKRIIRRANEVGIPVITATQMLESMVESPTPTRAEASDVANAILDGTDAVMLSAETAIGKHAVRAVETMARIAVQAESADRPPVRFQRSGQAYQIARSAVDLSSALDATALLVFTRSRHTAETISLNRPDRPAYALTPSLATARRLALWYAVEPIVGPDMHEIEQMGEYGIAELRRRGAVGEGDTVVLMGSSPQGPPNLINVRTIE